jgi:hypothetical protein
MVSFTTLSKEMQLEFLKWLEHKLAIRNPVEWYEVAKSHLEHYRGI